MRLSATTVRQVKSAQKSQKLTDGGGLYLLVTTKSGKYWRYDYRFANKRKTLSIGTYPEVSLANARKFHQLAREQLAQDVDPSEVKKIKKLTLIQAAADSFEAIAQEWFEIKMIGKSESYRVRTRRILEKDLYPYIGTRPISEITPPELLAVLRRIESRTVDIAHRAKQTGSLVFRYAIATGRAERDPSQDLAGALKNRTKRHHAAITQPAEVKVLMAAIRSYSGSLIVKIALELSALLFQRPGEIRQMEWSEINWKESRWEIPAGKMKMRQPHIVPLSKQAIALLQEINKLTGRGRAAVYVFPSARGRTRPLSDNAVRVALRTMGYANEQMTAHGFRAMARTMLDEVLGFRIDWIEHQLAHAVRDANGRAYNRTSHIEGRIKMMQDWADYLDTFYQQTVDG